MAVPQLAAHPDDYSERARTLLRGITVAQYLGVALGGFIGALYATPLALGSGTHVLAAASGLAAGVGATIAGWAHGQMRWKVEIRTTWLVGLALLGYIAASGLFRPWWPGGTLFSVFVFVTLLGLAGRQAALILFGHGRIREREAELARADDDGEAPPPPVLGRAPA